MATIRVDVKPELLRWACDRAGDTEGLLQRRFPNLDAWVRGEIKPTLKQLEDFARAARVAVGYLFLSQPPVERLPIRDMRTVGDKGIRRPSPELLDMVYLCQQRQEWYREFAERNDEDSLEFVGSATLETLPEEVAAQMRRLFDFNMAARQQCSNPDEMMRLLIERFEEVGVLVMVSGVVKNSTNRALKTDEFRGFALSDPLAPLIFVNGADAKPAQMFTLAHECAHLYLGESAVSDTSLDRTVDQATEKWCNLVAAEFLVPLAELRGVGVTNHLGSLNIYKRAFKVSTPVILRRLLDARMITRSQFDEAYAEAYRLITSAKPKSSGGDFYNTLPVRASKRFVRAVVSSAGSGETTYKETFKLLGINNVNTFEKIAKRVWS